MGEIKICGLSMEMEMAQKMNLIGKCQGCLYYEYFDKQQFCQKNGLLNNKKENCEDWRVDHR